MIVDLTTRPVPSEIWNSESSTPYFDIKSFVVSRVAVKIVVKMLLSTIVARVIENKGLESFGPGSGRGGGLLPKPVPMTIVVATVFSPWDARSWST